jgi:hypothetical protein
MNLVDAISRRRLISSRDQSAERSPVATAPRDRSTRSSIAAACIPVLIVIASSYDALLLSTMISWTPRNDFGRGFASVESVARGDKLYANNASIPWRLDETHTIMLKNLNPPHFHLLLEPLVGLSERAALGVWMIAGLICLLLSIARIGDEARVDFSLVEKGAAALASVVFVGTSTALITGHMSFLLLLMFTLGWSAARSEKWTESGVWLGIAASLKPFLLIFGVYYLIVRRARAVLSFSIALIACHLIGIVYYGTAAYGDWLANLSDAGDWSFMPMNASIMGFLKREFTLNPIFPALAYLSPRTIRAIWIAASAAIGSASLLVAARKIEPIDVDRGFAIVMIAALLISPLGWTYYFWLPVGPAFALAYSRGREANASSKPPQAAFLASKTLVFAALPGLAFPVFAATIAESSYTFSLLISNLYCFSLLCLFFACLIDGLARAIGRDPVPGDDRLISQPLIIEIS